MAYVGSPFEHDLFISYSHGDDGKGRGILRPWSQAFARELENELRFDFRLTRSLNVFFDAGERPGEGIDPMDGLHPQLQAHAGSSGLLVVLMSPHYLASRWCERERSWWLDGQHALGLPTQERIAIVRMAPTEPPWPAEFCDAQGEPLVGFQFHERVGTCRPLGWTELPDAFGKDFRAALVELAGHLALKLDALKVRTAALQRIQDEARRLQAHGGQAIYLHGRDDNRTTWERTALALSDEGFAVFPGEPDPPVSEPEARLKLNEQRVDTLGNCDALLLLGTADGRALDLDLMEVGRHNRQSARARSHRLLPCGVLDTVGPPVATEIRKRAARNLQADWLDGTTEPWLPRVHQWLTDKGTAAVQAP